MTIFEELEQEQKKLKAEYRKRYGTCLYGYVMGKASLKIIEKLLTLTDVSTFWDDVRRFTKNIHSDHNISMWQNYAEMRYEELTDAQRQSNNNPIYE